MNLVINFQLSQGQPRSFIVTLCYMRAKVGCDMRRLNTIFA